MILRTASSRGKATSVVALDPVREEDEEGEEGEEQQAAEELAGAEAGEEEQVETVGPAATDEDRPDVAGDEEQGAQGMGGVPLLRFSLPRSPDVIAAFLRTRVLRPDSEVRLSGLNALRKWVESQGHAQVPMDTVVPLWTTESNGDGGNGGTYALGAWVSEQRRAFRAGTLKAWRAELLDELGMVWSVVDARFYKNLAAAREYYAVHRTLAAPKDASIDGVAVGQWLANLRKTGGLGKDEQRATERRKALERIDRDWNRRGPSSGSSATPHSPRCSPTEQPSRRSCQASPSAATTSAPGCTPNAPGGSSWARGSANVWPNSASKRCPPVRCRLRRSP
ncbi:helicase associated domain-containing protein [Streptomyces decoyicus]|uniref:helicase associated domain-containing protein n=1 Tax=Streptomyces decoyicus TaxID=249567 RepID=UPI003F4CB0E7